MTRTYQGSMARYHNWVVTGSKPCECSKCRYVEKLDRMQVEVENPETGECKTLYDARPTSFDPPFPEGAGLRGLRELHAKEASSG